MKRVLFFLFVFLFCSLVFSSVFRVNSLLEDSFSSASGSRNLGVVGVSKPVESSVFVSLSDAFSVSLGSRVDVSLNKSFSGNSVVDLSIEKPVGSFVVSGSVFLPSRESLVRVVLVDSFGNEFLVLEAYPLISGNGFSFKDFCEETCFLDSVVPSRLKVQVVNASLVLDSFSFEPRVVKSSVGFLSSLKKIKQNQFKIQRINSNNLRWVAGDSFYSRLSYAEKKKYFGNAEFLPNLQGFDFYVSGVFELGNPTDLSKTYNVVSDPVFPAEFDWRKAHGKNWLTPNKSQGNCGACSIFATVASIETGVNIYFNDENLDLDLSEQQAVSCDPISKHICEQGTNTYATMYYYSNGSYGSSGIVKEDCFPYVAQDTNCIFQCSNPNFNSVEFGGVFSYGGSRESFVLNGERWLKENLIKRGTAASSVMFDRFKHGMELIGWRTDVDGKPIWIFKDSQLYQPFDEIKINPPYDLSVLYITVFPERPFVVNWRSDLNRRCVDNDGDGFYFWGLGEKPSSCGANVPPVEDCDDSNASLRLFSPGTFICSSNSVFCSDPDGEDIFRKTTVVSSSSSISDSCSSSSVVREAVCVNGVASTKDISCPSGFVCSDGACVSGSLRSCVDSDNGNISGRKGVLRYLLVNNAEWVVEDSCVDSRFLTEWFCDDSNYPGFSVVDCGKNGCLNGECVSASVDCNDSDGFNTNVRGFVSVSGKIYQDVCSGNKLKEQVCEAGKRVTKSVVCVNGCSEGVCLDSKPSVSCFDSDGSSYDVNGFVDVKGKRFVDYCKDSKTLIEQVCVSGKRKAQRVSCGVGCSNGFCFSLPKSNASNILLGEEN